MKTDEALRFSKLPDDGRIQQRFGCSEDLGEGAG
jgi:hypothetical protein